jgi:hypothetical protein
MPSKLVQLIQSNGRSDPLVLQQLVILVGGPADVSRLSDPVFAASFAQGIYRNADGIVTARYELPVATSGGTPAAAGA